MENISYDAYQAVELIIPGIAGGQTAQNFNFGDLPYLRPDMARIKAIEVYTSGTIAKGPLSGIPLLPVANMDTAFLTLYGGLGGIVDGNEIIQRIPLLKLNVIQNADTDPFVRSIFSLNSMKVNWSKSGLVFQTAPANTENRVVAFGVYFDFLRTL